MSPGSLPLASGEEPYLQLLAGLRGLGMTDSEAGVVARIARFAQSPRILEAIATEPKWYARWEVREALFQNALTPERHRDTLEASFAVIDLMRELLGKDLTDAAKDEIRQDIRSLLQSLPAVDVEIVKAHARELTAAASLPGSPPTALEIAAEPEGPTEEEKEEAAVQALAESDDPALLLAALGDGRERVRLTALGSARLADTMLLEAIQATTEPDFLLAVMTHPRWSFRDAVRKAVAANAAAPPAVRTLLSTTAGLLLQFMRYFNEPLLPDEKAETAKGILAEVQTLSGHEREYLKQKVGPAWTPFIKEVMAYIEDDFKRLQPVPVTTCLKPETPQDRGEPTAPTPLPEAARPARSAPDSPAAALAKDHFDDARHARASLHELPITGETRRRLGHLALDERARIAEATTSRDEITFLLHDPDDRVFEALLRNPALGAEERVACARMAPYERVRRIVANREVYALTGVKMALLHNPHTPQEVQLECLASIGSPRELLLVMRDPRIRSLEVKSKARGRLQERYRAMGTEERVAAVKQTGGDLLNELWTETFQDERTLVRLVSDRSLDEAVVLRIARSRIAPREVLSAIAREPAFINIYAVRLELAQNPKTPREIVAKLVPKLSPPDREKLRAAKGVADFVRELE